MDVIRITKKILDRYLFLIFSLKNPSATKLYQAHPPYFYVWGG